MKSSVRPDVGLEFQDLLYLSTFILIIGLADNHSLWTVAATQKSIGTTSCAWDDKLGGFENATRKSDEQDRSWLILLLAACETGLFGPCSFPPPTTAVNAQMGANISFLP